MSLKYRLLIGSAIIAIGVLLMHGGSWEFSRDEYSLSSPSIGLLTWGFAIVIVIAINLIVRKKG